MAYDRDVVVNCIKRHYDLLVRAAYLDPANIQYPPADGWSDEQLVVDVLRVLGRSDKVIDLLRHLPYIKDSAENFYIYHETHAMSYLRGTDLVGNLKAEECQGKDLCELLLMPVPADWPAGFISLSHGREGTWWVIDTTKGLVFPVGNEFIDDAPEDQPWLENSVPRKIQEYFDEVYKEIESLKMVPCPKGKRSHYPVIEPYQWDTGRVVKRVLLEHGWPKNLNKEEYLQALSEVHPEN